MRARCQRCAWILVWKTHTNCSFLNAFFPPTKSWKWNLARNRHWNQLLNLSLTILQAPSGIFEVWLSVILVIFLANKWSEGLNPHQDTPVEILHVVLLGFLKYMWWDVIQVELKNNKSKLALFETHLTSFNTSTLSLKPLNRRTLVQYSGSLTGHNFRSIVQVAPFVIHNLVGKECYDTWLSLSKLVPLIWQPETEDIDVYTVWYLCSYRCWPNWSCQCRHFLNMKLMYSYCM